MGKILDCQLQVAEEVKVPFKVFMEPRSSWRISVTKNGAILRLPKFFNAKDIEKKIDWSKDWLAKQFEKKPSLQSAFNIKNFVNGDTLTIAGTLYNLKISKGLSSNSFKAKVAGTEIHVVVPEVDETTMSNAMPKLLSKIAAKLAKQYIHARVTELNQLYFRTSIANIRFKYNTSNWGSCSSKSNINLSTRLLLAPVTVIDYVIIHELCHLVHMNHSDKFWNLVSSIMPDYKLCETWLKKNSHLCDFRPR